MAAITDLIDISRPGNVATFFDQNGTIQTAIANTPRINYRYDTTAAAWVIAGLLIESVTVTPLLLQTTNMFVSPWSGNALIGGNPGSLIESTEAAATHQRTQSITVTAGQTLTFSAYVRERPGSAKRFLSYYATGTPVGATTGLGVDAATGQVVAFGSPTKFRATPAGALGWLIEYTLTTVADGTLVYTCRLVTALGGVGGYTGDGTSGIDLNEHQVELGTVATSRIRQTTAAVTRSADAVTKTLGGEYNPAAHTADVVFRFDTVPPTGTVPIYCLSIGPLESDRLFLYVANGLLRGETRVAGVQTTLSFGAISPGTYRAAISFSGTTFRMAVNGTVLAEATTAPLAVMNKRSLGRSANGGGFNGHIVKVTEYPFLMSRSQMQEITAGVVRSAGEFSIGTVTATTAELNWQALPTYLFDTVTPTYTISAVMVQNREVQIAPRADFQFCLAPVFGVGSGTSYTANGLNQSATYYLRSRPVTAGGARAPWGDVQGFRTPQATVWATAAAAVLITPALIVPPEPVLEWRSYVDDAGQNSGHPARALGRDDPTTTFYCNQYGGPDVYEFAIRTAGAPVDTFALLGTNIPEASIIAVKGGNTLDEARGSFAPYQYSGSFRPSANVPGRPSYHGLIRLPAPQSYRFWQVVIYAAIPGGILAATYFAHGLALSTKNHSVDLRETPTNAGTIDRDRFGLPDRLPGMLGRTTEFDISVMTEAQYHSTYALLDQRRGMGGPMLVVPNSKPGAFLHDRILYGDVDPIAMSSPSSPRFTIGVKVKSLI